MIETIRANRAPAPKPKPDASTLGFGDVFTDHMLLADYSPERGWTNPRIEPYGPLVLDPAAAVLHYGQGVFEGLKAFRGVDGQVRLFRPQQHLARLNRSAHRLCIPPLDPELALAWLVDLVGLEQDWVPEGPGTALYVRPTIVASEPFLGVRPAETYLFFVILSPVGTYQPSGIHSMAIRVEERYARAVAGGVGAAKTGGNYAAGLLATEEAHAAGFSQVLWLDGASRQLVDEVGMMNIMLRIGDQVLTPSLSDTFLPGVTRDSALTLLHEWGVDVVERPIAIDEVVEAIRLRTLREMWGTGTAAVVAPVGELGYRGERHIINGGEIGTVTHRLYDALIAIQHATVPDTHGWTVPI
ncbi:MAG: branched-chain amino acid aminotransferase [Chloroflexota bacterium]|jgi:branched-chain amino acid aminotransferase|nr:branched-chain amino acid aminotransferase [Chloroflexota bacterium]